jgi:thiamine-phosphate pyrophosphorylase
MKLIVISPQSSQPGEHRILTSMLEEGLETLHLRKPKFSTNQMRMYIEGFDPAFHNRLVIHSHHELAGRYRLKGVHLTRRHRTEDYISTWIKLKIAKLRRSSLTVSSSFHTLQGIANYNPEYNYVFISPVFESISKLGYTSTFNENSLLKILKETNYLVYALGGIHENNIEKAAKMGFGGVCLYGSLWENNYNPVQTFVNSRNVCRSIQSPASP